jgi:hypothetical protein
MRRGGRGSSRSLLRLLIEDIQVTGWHIQIRLRIPLDGDTPGNGHSSDPPPTHPRRPQPTSTENRLRCLHGRRGTNGGGSRWRRSARKGSHHAAPVRPPIQLRSKFWYGATGVRLLSGAGTPLGGDAYDVEDLAGLLRRYRLNPRDLTDLSGGALVVDVDEIGGDEAAVVRFTLGG